MATFGGGERGGEIFEEKVFYEDQYVKYNKGEEVKHHQVIVEWL